MTLAQRILGEEKRYRSQRVIVGEVEGDISGGSVQATGGSGFRTLSDWAADGASLGAFGGLASASDNAAAITSAETAGRSFVPTGTFVATTAAASLNGPFWGSGQIQDGGGNKRAPWFSAVKSRPSPLGTYTSAETAFNGDLSQVQIAMEHRITGSATLGQPTTGYLYTPEAYPLYGYMFNSSGYNHETDGNDGRTAAVFHRVQITQAGQGDAVAFNASVFVSSAKSGATDWLASPAGVLFNGQVSAGIAYAYLNPFELLLTDNGYDVSGAGAVLNLDRDGASAALNTYWVGFRAQSIGSQAVDDAFFAIGPYSRGLTLVMGDYTSGAAVVMGENQRVYWDATYSGTNTYRLTGLGTASTYFDGATLVTTAPITIQPGASVTPASNGDVVFELTNNTTLTFKAKGSDGTVRSGTVTLT